MRVIRKGSRSIAALALGTALILSSCTCMIKEPELNTIKQLRTEEKQLTADIEAATKNKAKVNTELSAREAELRKCTEDRTFIQDKLNKWPNVWPE